MNPQIRHAQRACEAAKARQAVVVFIDDVGQYAVVSYGETKAECAAVKPLCNAIADALDDGELPMPGGSSRLGGERKSESFCACGRRLPECDGSRAGCLGSTGGPSHWAAGAPSDSCPPCRCVALRECVAVLVYWHDRDNGHIDESWWDEARALVALEEPKP